MWSATIPAFSAASTGSCCYDARRHPSHEQSGQHQVLRRGWRQHSLRSASTRPCADLTATAPPGWGALPGIRPSAFRCRPGAERRRRLVSVAAPGKPAGHHGRPARPATSRHRRPARTPPAISSATRPESVSCGAAAARRRHSGRSMPCRGTGPRPSPAAKAPATRVPATGAAALRPGRGRSPDHRRPSEVPAGPSRNPGLPGRPGPPRQPR